MPRSPHSLLGALVLSTLAITVVLGWSGYRLIEQQQLLDEQRVRMQSESAADALAADLRGRLAEVGERLSGWVATPSGPLPSIDGAVVLGVRGDHVELSPRGGLPYIPFETGATLLPHFTSLELLEMRGQSASSVAGYRALADHRDPTVRAGALLRLARVQRKLGALPAALTTYERLVRLGDVTTDGLPAELIGLQGQRATYEALRDAPRARLAAQRVREGLDSGRWLLTRGVASLYREPFTDPRPASWHIAAALSEVWQQTESLRPSQGYRVVEGASEVGHVLVLWRSNGVVTAALAAPAHAFLALPGRSDIQWHLSDEAGTVLGGDPHVPATAVTRIVSTSYPWTLQTWRSDRHETGASSSRARLLGMIGATLVFVWAASYLMTRAIRHDAAVARLRSDFLAAVSHEFRSPLTAVRQIAEMLEGGRVPTEERRRVYYGTLAAEATRLHRLVETLLDFGRMEAGAEHYRLVDMDATTLIREVVSDLEPHARALGKAVQVEGPETMPLRADRSALGLALRKLVDNALKYSPDATTVWIRWGQQDKQVAIRVTDTGLGIPASEQGRIFDKFVRGREAIDRNISGTGIGLAIVRQVATGHGGDVTVESALGRGSTFTLLLPAAGARS